MDEDELPNGGPGDGFEHGFGGPAGAGGRDAASPDAGDGDETDLAGDADASHGPGEPDDDAVEALAQEAASLGEEERWEEAHALLTGGLDDHGEHPLLLCWLGIASQRLEREGEAYEWFRAALAKEPQDPFVLAAAGSGVALYDDPEAEGALRLAALTAPQLPFARAAYGAYLAREGMPAEGAAELEAARDLTPEDAAVRAELVVAYLLAGRAEFGLAELEEALALRGDDAWLRGVYGLALGEAGRHEEGAEQLHRASVERPEDVELALLAALAAAGEGWEDEAWNSLARAEGGADASDRDLIRAAEEAVEGGADAASELLRDELGPTLLRERLLQRS